MRALQGKEKKRNKRTGIKRVRVGKRVLRGDYKIKGGIEYGRMEIYRNRK